MRKFTAKNENTYKIKEMSQEELLFNYEMFLWKLIHFYCKREEQKQDIFQAAYLELLRCRDNFNPERGVFFTTYCKPFIIEKIKQEITFLTYPLSMCYPVSKKRIQNGMSFVDYTLIENVVCAENADEKTENTSYLFEKMIQKIQQASIEEKQKKKLLYIIDCSLNGKKNIKLTKEIINLFRTILGDNFLADITAF